MQETKNRVQCALNELAERMIRRYVRGLVVEDWLVERLMQAWQQSGSAEEEPDWRALELLALSLCSQALCEACSSSDAGDRELGFENLRRSMEEMLSRAAGSACLQMGDLRADVLQQTSLEILRILQRQGGGPDRPAAFLKWVRVILFRQLSQYLRQAERGNWLSLEMQPESMLETLVDWRDTDPLDAVLRTELQGDLKEAILALKNPQYRQVLLDTYFAEIEERELAANWQVRVQDIYLWRCRALKALRKQEGLRQLA